MKKFNTFINEKTDSNEKVIDSITGSGKFHSKVMDIIVKHSRLYLSENDIDRENFSKAIIKILKKAKEETK